MGQTLFPTGRNSSSVWSKKKIKKNIRFVVYNKKSIIFVLNINHKHFYIMNTFYGKQLNTLTFNELTLLSIDIQLSAFDKMNMTDQRVLSQSESIREGFMTKCLEEGYGDYSRERFLHDYNGTRPTEIEGGYDEYIEVTNFLSLN
ncbi:hypothetical protein DCBHLPFO_00765 [Mycoplasmopsis arginini]|uniref:Uncharacterized protein n=2 Tax=Mycoplasmopsis arginini TaxID=2094 RepID=A0AA43QWZ1_MYCAR|nr:hypothetical protein [Mycoplasmopsis arginini]